MLRTLHPKLHTQWMRIRELYEQHCCKFTTQKYQLNRLFLSTNYKQNSMKTRNKKNVYIRKSTVACVFSTQLFCITSSVHFFPACWFDYLLTWIISLWAALQFIIPPKNSSHAMPCTYNDTISPPPARVSASSRQQFISCFYFFSIRFYSAT